MRLRMHVSAVELAKKNVRSNVFALENHLKFSRNIVCTADYVMKSVRQVRLEEGKQKIIEIRTAILCVKKHKMAVFVIYGENGIIITFINVEKYL